MEIYKEFRFEAAHFLPKVSRENKCSKLHGHSYQIIIFIEGEVNGESGMLIDFDDIQNAFTPTLKQLDHSVLNEIEGLENPTSENMAIWLWEKLSTKLPILSKIEVSETCSTGCIYRGKNN